MDISKTILDAITHALESEELRLKPRSERPGEPLWPWTVLGYREDWIRYLLVREISGRIPDRELRIETEVGGLSQVDLSIHGLFSVELKGPYEVKENFDQGLYNKILEDFEKQRCRANKKPNLKHFVLLILHAPKACFYSGFLQGWLTELETEVRNKNHGICIEVVPSKPLVLNGNEPWLMECCLYRVS